MISAFLYIFIITMFIAAIVAMILELGNDVKNNLDNNYNPPFYTKDNWYHVLNPATDDTLIDSSEIDYQWYNEE